MGSVKQLLTNAHDPILDKEVDLLADTDAGLQMEQHKCNSTILAYQLLDRNHFVERSVSCRNAYHVVTSV